MTKDILVFQPSQRDRDYRRVRFHRKERGPILAFFQTTCDRLPALRCENEHPTFRQSIQRGTDRSTVRLPAVYPDDPIGAKYRPDQPVIVQLDLADAFDRRKWKGRAKQNSIRIAKMIENDNGRALFREIFQAAESDAQGHKDEEPGESAKKGAKDAASER